MLLALPHFKGPVALQVNLSCPNTGENLRELEHEAVEILHILGERRIALVPKFNVMTSPQTVKRISEEVEIDGVSISNTIPYGQLAEQLDFERLFGNVSPLSKLGGGGLSGKSLYPLVYSWLNNARDERLALPINAGGGIFYEHQVDELFSLGAQSLSIASVIMLRPWRVPSIIAAAYKHSSRVAEFKVVSGAV